MIVATGKSPYKMKRKQYKCPEGTEITYQVTKANGIKYWNNVFVEINNLN